MMKAFFGCSKSNGRKKEIRTDLTYFFVRVFLRSAFPFFLFISLDFDIKKGAVALNIFYAI